VSKYQQRSGSCIRKRDEVTVRFGNKNTSRVRFHNTINFNEDAISGQGVPNSTNNLTVMIMTLNDMDQLKDVLNSLAPQTANCGSNIQILNKHFSPTNECMTHKQLSPPKKIRDSLKLNTHRIKNKEKDKIHPKIISKLQAKSIHKNLSKLNKKEFLKIASNKFKFSNFITQTAKATSKPTHTKPTSP
jgi:hypothetical protein